MLKVVPAIEDSEHRVVRFADVLEELLERLTWATTMVQVNLAAAEAADALKGATLSWEAPASLRAVEP